MKRIVWYPKHQCWSVVDDVSGMVDKCFPTLHAAEQYVISGGCPDFVEER